MRRFWTLALFSVAIFLWTTGIALGRGLTMGVENDGVPQGGVLTLKPYYDFANREQFYTVNLTTAKTTFWQQLSYVSATEIEYHPQPSRYNATYYLTEQGLEAVFGHVAVGGGVAAQYNPGTKTQMQEVFGTFAWKLWD